MNKALNMLVLSDVHLGHRTTSTEHIVQSLSYLIRDDSRFAELDLLFIAGDLFDRLLYLPSPEVDLIYKWLNFLLRLCKKHDVVLRVLEGTPSHDNKQPSLIMSINNESGIGCDVKYVDILDIEYIDRFDIHVLYIPDEWMPDCGMVLAEVKNKLKECKLEQVDFAIMHGQFDYQVPSKLLNTIPNHNSEEYLKLVKYLIFIGHVHSHSQYERIIAQGSTDRLRHGEEDDKGIVRATVYPNGEYDLSFIINHNAKVYKTVDLMHIPENEVYNKVMSIIRDLPDGSYIRLLLTSSTFNSSLLKELKKQYTQFHWSTLTERSVNYTKEVAKPQVAVQMEAIRKDTLPKMVHTRVEHSRDLKTADSVIEILKEIMDGHATSNAISEETG